MGEIVLAAKMTHVPTMLMSEQGGPVKGKRQAAIDGHLELGEAIARTASDLGVHPLSHRLDSLELEYGTLVPMHVMAREHAMKVISVAAWCAVHDHDESRVVGAAIARAVEAGDSKVLLVAFGSLSHKIRANREYAANNGTFTISSEFNRQMDLNVLEMWQRGDHATFLKMLGDYARYCCGEGSMHDTAMLYGALGRDAYDAKCEVVTPNFPSSGTGQTNVVFPAQ